MTPPYKLVDMATGQDVPNFVGMDTAVGRYIEVYSGAQPGDPLERISDGALKRTDGQIDPPPINPPPTGAGMDYPKDENELAALLQGYAQSQIVGVLDPRTNIEVSRTIVLQVPNTGRPWGVDGNYASITYRGSGDDLIRIEGTANVNNRGLTLKNLVLDGGDAGNMSGGGASSCLRVSAPLGDVGPIYKFHLENIYASGAVNGLILEGGVYEGEMKNIHVENCTGDGIILRHLPQTPEGKAPVVSNVLMIHINSSRNYGCGLRTVYSVYLVGGSFVLNGGGGVVAPDGIRGAIFCNGENSGGENQCVFDVPSNGYGSYIGVGEASSDGATVCRAWKGDHWEDVGKPLLYFAAVGPGVVVENAHVSYYGAGPGNPMKVLKP